MLVIAFAFQLDLKGALSVLRGGLGSVREGMGTAPPKTSGNKSKRNRPSVKVSLFGTKIDMAKSHSKSIL